jgi:hypothetical protein
MESTHDDLGNEKPTGINRQNQSVLTLRLLCDSWQLPVVANVKGFLFAMRAKVRSRGHGCQRGRTQRASKKAISL